MLRNIFVFGIIFLGSYYALQGPFYALLFYIWNAYFRPELWVWDSTVQSLNLSFIIGIYLVVTALFSAKKMRLNVRTGLILVFFLQCLISALLSEHADWSWTFFVEFAKVLLVSYLIVVLADDVKKFRILMLVMAYSLGFECAKQGWAQTILNPGAQNNNIVAFLGDNNGVALGTMMMVPIFVALAQTATRPWERYLHQFFLVGVFLRGITTYSRGGFLAAGALGLLTFIRSPRKVRALVSMAIVVSIVTTVMPQQFWDRMESIAAPADERDVSAQGRIHFWAVAQTMATAKPLTGVGLNAYARSYRAYDTTGNFAGDRSVHSIWFGTLAELGYPGLLLFLAIWLGALAACRRVITIGKAGPSRQELVRYGIGFQVSLIVFGVGGTFLPAHYNEMYWHFIGATTALWLIALAVAEAPQEALAPVPPATPTLTHWRPETAGRIR